MATNYRPQVTLNNVSSHIDTFDQTHLTGFVTWTATMGHGSLLAADFTEGAAADAATVEYAIDMPQLIENDFQVGDDVQVNLANQMNVFNEGALKYSDTDVVDGSACTALLAKNNTFKTIVNG